MSRFEATNHITEEFWYLTQNEQFQKAIISTRKKYNIPEKGWINSSLNFYDSHITVKSKENIKHFHKRWGNDIKKLMKHTSGNVSKHDIEFRALLENYVIYNDISSFYGSFLTNPLPNITYQEKDARIHVNIELNYDTTEPEVIVGIRSQWDKIKRAQAQLGGKRRGTSKDFSLKKTIWELHQQKLLITDISNYLTNHNIPSPTNNEISQYIRRVKLRISTAYK